MKSLLILVFFSFLCVGLGTVIAFPLLKFAIYCPRFYTITVLSVICISIVIRLIKKLVKGINKKITLTSILFILIIASGFCSEPIYPEISELNSRDFLYVQYQEEVQAARKAIKSGKKPYINFYSYTTTKDDNIFTVSARCSITQESISTINGIENSSSLTEGIKLILPTVPGLYIPLEPVSQIDFLLAKENSILLLSEEYPVYEINRNKYYFIKDARFSPEARAFFLDSGMGLPLAKYILTSSFGMRKSPISGNWNFHKGIDMAAPKGTDVMSCKGGIVSFVGKNDYIYGNYIVIKHDNDITSTYAHLSEISVSKGQVVSKGSVIGKVGATGLTTGPHLHFEIQSKGEAENPQNYIKGGSKNAKF